MDPLETMVQTQIVQRGVRDPAVLEALRTVPRDAFVPHQWRRDAFADEPLPIGHGQTISQPFIVALMTEALLLGPTNRVLEIGTGSGYQTAILARLARWVYSIERIPALVSGARHQLDSLGIRNITLREGDGSLGWEEEAPFDRILIAAAAPQAPYRLLKNQLAEGGIAILPAGDVYDQQLLRITREKHALREEILCDCRFVKLIGQEGWPDADTNP